MFRRSLFFMLFLIGGMTNAVTGSAILEIHRNEIHGEVRAIADKYVRTLPSSKKFDYYSLPSHLKADYEQHLATAESTLTAITYANSDAFIALSEVEDETKREINNFLKKLDSAVLSSNLDEKINDAICDLIHKNGMVKDEIVKHAATEYNSRYSNVKSKFVYKTYATTSEIETAVYNEFTALIKRVKAQVKSNSASTQSDSGSWQDFWDWLSSGKSSASNNNYKTTSKYTYTYYSDYDLVYSNDLDNKVLEITNRVLKDKSYDPEAIPARVISDYSDTVQKIIRKTKEKMGYASSIYVYLVRNIAQDEIKTIIDKIKYKGESCSICLDDIKSWQTLGVLSCGHFYHNDCIKKALTYEYKCPLCGTYTSKVDHTESVPWQ